MTLEEISSVGANELWMTRITIKVATADYQILIFCSISLWVLRHTIKEASLGTNERRTLRIKIKVVTSR